MVSRALLALGPRRIRLIAGLACGQRKTGAAVGVPTSPGPPADPGPCSGATGRNVHQRRRVLRSGVRNAATTYYPGAR